MSYLLMNRGVDGQLKILLLVQRGMVFFFTVPTYSPFHPSPESDRPVFFLWVKKKTALEKLVQIPYFLELVVPKSHQYTNQYFEIFVKDKLNIHHI